MRIDLGDRLRRRRSAGGRHRGRGTSGYFKPSDIAEGVWEWNGQLFTAAGWKQLNEQLQDQAQWALAAAISKADPTVTVDQAYNELTYDHTSGGNADFTYSGDLSFLGGPGSGPSSRYGGAPSIHYSSDGFLHLDTVNPFWPAWWFPIGSVGHFFGGLLGGNLAPQTPLGHQ